MLPRDAWDVLATVAYDLDDRAGEVGRHLEAILDKRKFTAMLHPVSQSDRKGIMHTQDFEAIAEILAGDLATSTPEQAQKVVVLTFSLADYFQKANPNFNRSLFYARVGIGGPEPLVWESRENYNERTGLQISAVAWKLLIEATAARLNKRLGADYMLVDNG